MVTKKDVNKLLNKGLTGMEAARLIILDSVEVDHQRKGFLSKTDIQRVRNSFQGTVEIQSFNRWIGVYRLVDFTVKEGQILIMEAVQWLEISIKELEKYRQEAMLRSILMFDLPAIVTEKQYQELNAKQRERKLKELYTLRSVLSLLAEDLASEDLKTAWRAGDEEGSYDELIDYLEEIGSDLYGQAIQQGLQLVRDGKLKPVQLQEKEIKRLKDLEAEADKERAKDYEIEVKTVKARLKPLSDICDRERQLIEASYQAAKAGQSQEILLSLMEKLKDGSWQKEEMERLQDYTYCTGEELYQLGLARQVEDIDKYQPNLDEETMARPLGAVQSDKTAIIQDPEPEDLDERGYYKDSGLEALARLSRYGGLDERKADVPAFIKRMHRQASENIKAFLALQAVIGTIEEILRVKLQEDLDKRYAHLELTVQYYNVLLTKEPPHYLGLPKLKELKIGKLKPTDLSVRYYRERMAMTLGAEWWSEALRTLDLQAEDKDSIAQKASEDWKKASEIVKKEEEDLDDGW